MKRTYLDRFAPKASGWHLALPLLLACGGGGDKNVGFGVDDGGGSDREIVDGGPGKDGGGKGGSGGGTMPQPGDPVIDIVVKSPVENAAQPPIVNAKTKFAPAVDVSVTTIAPALPDDIKSLTVYVSVPPKYEAGTQVPINTSKPSENDAVAGKRTFFFGDTPVPLSGLKSGDAKLVFTATTVGGVVRTKEVTFRIDAGPEITIVDPDENEPFKASVVVQVAVQDAFPITNVVMTIGNVEVPITDKGGGQYSASLEFGKFVPPLDGEQLITIRATNQNGTVQVAQRQFVVDNDGPKIANTAPAVGVLIGGVIELTADVTDPAGVVPESVVAVVAHGDATFAIKLNPPLAGQGPTTYRARFDTTKLPDNAIFPSVSFRASDRLGNESTVGYLTSLDNKPPLADLDPPAHVREFRKSGNQTFCSWEFDPVGPDAVDDGNLVNQAFDIRARVEDQGNHVAAGGADFIPIAGVKKVELLILNDTSQALVVDNDGDTVDPVTMAAKVPSCDVLNPLLTPTTTPMSSKDALLLDMVPIPVAGTPDMTLDPGSSCLSGSVPTMPEPLCFTTENFSKAVIDPGGSPHARYLTYAKPYTDAAEPAIWTLSPVKAGLQCAGRQFDSLGSSLPDGWACLAVVATDKLDRMQVSRPIRICVDFDGDGKECPHKRITRVTADSPMKVFTAEAHGLATGAKVAIQDVEYQSGANGTHTITVTGPNEFTLNDANPNLWVGIEGSTGLYVPAALMPSCVGVQTGQGVNPTVDGTKACGPWRSYQDPDYYALP